MGWGLPAAAHSSSFPEQVFSIFDKDGSGSISFDEYITFLSVAVRGTLREKLQMIFKIYGRPDSKK